MSELGLLMGLLVLAYVGSLLVEGRTASGVGLPSGIEWLVLGFVLGPHVLGVVGEEAREGLAPIVQAAVAWLAFVEGLRWARRGSRAVPLTRVLVGAAWSSVTAASVGAAVFFTVPWVLPESGRDRMALALAIGAATSETTRSTLLWVRDRHGARGPLTTLLGDIASTEDIVPALVLAYLFASSSPVTTIIPLPVGARFTLTLGLGITLGAMAAALLGRELRVRETWGALAGTTLMACGLAGRLGLAALSVTFVMGLTIRLLSPHVGDLRALVLPTERPVLLPVLLVAGASIDHPQPWGVAVLVAICASTRVVAQLVSGAVLAMTSRSGRKGGPLLGLGLLSSGRLSLWIGLAVALEARADIGATTLAVASAITLLGEIAGAPALRAALEYAGEIGSEATRASNESHPAEGTAA